MVRIAITQAAVDAIAKTLPLGSVGYENKVDEKAERLIWLEPSAVDRHKPLSPSSSLKPTQCAASVRRRERARRRESRTV
jgi:hypothetical protein